MRAVASLRPLESGYRMSGARLKAALRLAARGLDPRPAMRTETVMQAKGSSERQRSAPPAPCKWRFRRLTMGLF
jgi:hypothetical protein